MRNANDEYPPTASRLRDETTCLAVDAFKFGSVLVAIVAITPRNPEPLIDPAVFFVEGAIAAALVIWRIVQFLNALSD